MSNRRPLRLSTYLALTRMGGATRQPYPTLDAKRPVVWCHAEDVEQCKALVGLCARILQQRDDVQFVITGAPCDFTNSKLWNVPVIPVATPDEATLDIEAFLDWAKPSLCLWSGNALRPALMDRANAKGCRLIALNLADKPFTIPGKRWLPDCSAAVLAECADLFAIDEPAMRALRRMGISGRRLHMAGQLREAVVPPAVNEDLREEVAASLTGRLTWLAAHTRPEEVADMLQAHVNVMRYSHRSLLLLALQLPPDPDELRAQLARAGLKPCFWDDGDEIEESTQVVVSSDPNEIGLWYSVAPITFMGGSLVSGQGGHDPFFAATLGSAILYGPNVGQHLAAYSVLVEAGAARIVRDSNSLAQALRATMAADVAARMALAGWRVVTEGADLTDRLTQLVLETLDIREMRR